ncbi:hypothetical protein FACS189454_02470 [Planctomycetales bacterium]|nr:hypothetical protein FACS189454_02470 [Planctomycetales bacterium]
MRIFISHSEKDKDIIDSFVDLLQTGCNVREEDIFCTSVEGMSIPKGKDFIVFIEENIKDAGLIIAIISPYYYESVFCLCELGASWALKKNIFPLLVPPLGYNDLKAVIAKEQCGKIDDQSDLDELNDKLRECGTNTPRWNLKRDEFLCSIKSIINKNPRTFTKKSIEEFESIREQYSQALEDIQGRNSEMENLKEQIESLKLCKEKKDVIEVMQKYSSERQQFDELVLAVKEAFKPLSRCVKEVLYYTEHNPNRDNDYVPSYAGVEYRNAVDDGYLEQSRAGHNISFSLKTDNPYVVDAHQVLANLDKFMEKNATTEFGEQFVTENKYQFELSNKQFWDNFLF